MAKTNEFATPSPVSNVGANRKGSMTIGSDGLPIMVAYTNTPGVCAGLCVVHCRDFSCKTTDKTPIDSDGYYASITIGANGNPIIAYTPDQNELRVAICSDILCNNKTIKNGSNLGVYGVGALALTIGINGGPIISYSDGDLYMYVCTNASCDDGSIKTIANSGFFEGSNHALAIGVNGNPIIAYDYYDSASQRDLRVASCLSSTCNEFPAVSTVDTAVNRVTGLYPSMTINDDGFPIIAYHCEQSCSGGGNLRMMTLRCGTTSCSSGNTITAHDVNALGAADGLSTSIAIGADNLPIISYYSGLPSFSAGGMKILKCGTIACGAGNSFINDGIDAGIGNISALGHFSSIAIAGDGVPVIMYYSATGNTIRFLHCANDFCRNAWTRR